MQGHPPKTMQNVEKGQGQLNTETHNAYITCNNSPLKKNPTGELEIEFRTS